MINKHINDLLEHAENNLLFAEKELSRPSEHTVTITVCHSSNNAIREYLVALIAYNYSLEYPQDELIRESLNKIKSWDINHLVEYASKLDSRFATLDLSNVNCAAIEKENASDVYCLSIDKVRKCSDTAKEIARLVNEYINSTKQPRDNAQLHKLMQLALN